MDSQLYLDIGTTISQLTGRTLARVHPQLGVKVSPCGEVFVPGDKWHKAHWTFGCKNSCGYRLVKIAGKLYFVHRLIVEAFIGKIPEGHQVDHINRDPSSNFLSNLRIVSKSGNRRNRADHDRVTEQGRTHFYEDEKQYWRERDVRYKESKRKTHRQVCFADGSKHWVPLPEAESLLKIPLSQRIFKG